MLGRIEKLDFSKNRKPKACIDGTWYFCESHHNMTPGMKVEFDAHQFQSKDGKYQMWALDKWGPAKDDHLVETPKTNGHAMTSSAPIDPSEAGILKSLIEAGVIREKFQYKEWLDFIRHPFVDRMAQIAERSAKTKVHNEQAGRIIGAFNVGNEKAALEIWLESMSGSETDSAAVWAALPTTVQQRLQDLRDEANLHGSKFKDDEPDF